MILFTLIAQSGEPNPLQAARNRMRRIRESLWRKGIEPGDWTWTIEANPSGTGYHAHAVQHGPFLPQAALDLACRKAGSGYPWIRLIKGRPGQSARYGLKGFGASGYGLKTFRADKGAMDALELNGGRLEHHTRGFFRISGRPSKVRAVESEAINELYPDRGGHYVVVRSGVLSALLDPGSVDLRARIAASAARR